MAWFHLQDQEKTEELTTGTAEFVKKNTHEWSYIPPKLTYSTQNDGLKKVEFFKTYGHFWYLY